MSLRAQVYLWTGNEQDNEVKMIETASQFIVVVIITWTAEKH